MKVTWLQTKSLGNVKANFELMEEMLLSSQKNQKTDLLILQELCFWDYFCITENPAYFDQALSNDSIICQSLAKLAKENKMVIVFPYFEKRTLGLYHNSVIVFEKDGSIAGIYRKMHIPDDPGFYEKYYFTPGDLGFKPIKTSVGNLGVLICWDQWFPEGARIMALNGADILIYPTAIGWDDLEPENIKQSQLEAWQTIMRAHAIANGLHTIAVNRIGQEGHLNFWGNSFCADPFGRLIEVDKNTENSITSFSLDLNKTEEARRVWPFFRDRRIDHYQDLSKIWGQQ